MTTNLLRMRGVNEFEEENDLTITYEKIKLARERRERRASRVERVRRARTQIEVERHMKEVRLAEVKRARIMTEKYRSYLKSMRSGGTASNIQFNDPSAANPFSHTPSMTSGFTLGTTSG